MKVIGFVPVAWINKGDAVSAAGAEIYRYPCAQVAANPIPLGRAQIINVREAASGCRIVADRPSAADKTGSVDICYRSIRTVDSCNSIGIIAAGTNVSLVVRVGQGCIVQTDQAADP